MDILAMGEPMMEFSEVADPVRGRVYLPGFGGDTSNFAVAAARQGAKVGYLTRVGADAFGDEFLKLWQAEGIATDLVVRDPAAPTGIYFITHTAKGHQFTYYRKGSAASRIRPEELPEEALANLRLLHVSGISQGISESSCDAVLRAIEVARGHGALISYDPNLRLKLWPLPRARAVIHATAEQADIFLPSLEDAQQLTGQTDPDRIIDRYLALGIRLIALKLGREGVLVATPTTRERVAGYRVATVDATGAGDTFDGAFVTQLLRGAPPAEAARYANAAAALSTTGYGAVAPIPTREQVEAFLREQA
ncbi:MAG: sugar kinase [Bacillota bacterium]